MSNVAYGLICGHVFAASQTHVSDCAFRAVAGCCILSDKVDASNDSSCGTQAVRVEHFDGKEPSFLRDTVGS